MSTAPKKETNLNVKVSIINHLGGKGAPCESRQSIGTLAANKVPCTLAGVLRGAMWALPGQMRRRVLNMCAEPTNGA